MELKILHVVGARPNFMKVAPIISEMSRRPGEFDQRLVHTGQHYDKNMSDTFFRELGIPEPDQNLGIGSGTHAEQTAQIMLGFEPVVCAFEPDCVIVVGDVNSSLAATLVAVKLGISVAHVEAGLRSFDRSMPEELNRVLIDQVADILLTPSPDADSNLRREGVSQSRVVRVGNVMIDALVGHLPAIRTRTVRVQAGLSPREYVLVTLHRPANVDDGETLGEIVDALIEVSRSYPVVFPVHPRTRSRIDALGRNFDAQKLKMLEPLGYLDFAALVLDSKCVLTDSGGVQEETTFLGVPCITIRTTTERPITIQLGTNVLVPARRADIVLAVSEAQERRLDGGASIELWDGRAAQRIVDVLRSEFG